MCNNDSSNTIQVRLTLDVTYALNGENPAEMAANLRRMCERAIGAGLLTGESDAEVDGYEVYTMLMPEPLAEGKLTEFMRQRIEDGHLSLKDIPMRLARYGLMEPDAFIAEMRERMGGEENTNLN